MKHILSYKTTIGTFYIGKSDDNQYHPLFNDNDLGSYANMWEAVKDLTVNNTKPAHSPESNELLDTSTLELPEDYIEWERVKN